ncbi:MAG: DNA repair protein RecN [Candidatus Ozemobacter sibiricus]|uniref:DNA repair protein RecN n=1 Tax=Candidatus Ozemobacter sibiricus TaxID=2268124 RepID=A0A367ZQD8_9BACT|nr:MAG: DNA repair protein RecN [Candidatus Ozemobacter sibiricus]
MLTELVLENFLFVREAHLTFGPGLNVITGETGAGKSLLLEGVKLILGKKGKAGLVLPGAAAAKVHAVFDLSRVPGPRAVLDRLGFTNEETPASLVITRTFRPEGSDKIFINGILATSSALKDLGRSLMEIHGQNEHQTLLQPETQRRLLDRTGGDLHARRLLDLRQAWETRQALQRQLDDLEERLQHGSRRLADLEDTLRVLDGLDLRDPGEEEALRHEADRLSHAEAIASALQTGAAALGGSDDQVGAVGLLRRTRDALFDILPHAPDLAPLHGRLESLFYEVEDIDKDLRAAAEAVVFDPERLAWVQNRLGEIHRACRRFGTDPAGLLALREDATREMAELTAPDSTREQLRTALAQAQARYSELATATSSARRQLAIQLQKLVSQAMDGLGFATAKFQVEFRPLDPGPEGAETVEFLVGLNPGTPAGPLRKIASGGELSRVALALKRVLARGDDLPTLLFDEIDAGIGGTTAEAVAASLRELGATKQVLLVTHLHQIAKEGDRHFTVVKSVANDRTEVTINLVQGRDREAEIARMVGRTDDDGRAFARSLLARSPGRTPIKPEKSRTTAKN